MASDTEKILLIYESNLNQLTAEHQKLHIEMQKTDVKAKATADSMISSFSSVGNVLGDVKKEASNVASEFASGLGALAVASAIAGLIKVCVDLVDSFKSVTKQTETVTEAIEKSKKSITDNTNRIAEGYFKIQQAVGNLSKKEAEAAILSVKNSQERKDRIQQFSNDYVRLAGEIGISIDRLNKKGGLARGVDPNEVLKIRRFNIEYKKLQTDFQKDLRILTARQISDDAVLRAQDAAKKLEDLRARQKKEAAESERLLKEELDKLKKINSDFAKNGGFELSIPVLDVKRQFRQQKEVEDKLKASQKRIAENFKKSQEQQVEAAIRAAEKMREIEKAKQGIQQETINVLIQSLDLLRQSNEKRTTSELDEAQKRSDNEVEKFDNALKRREISQEEYDKNVSSARKKQAQEEREIKRRTFESNKQISLIQTIISTAQATIAALGNIPYTPANIGLAAATAAAGAVQIALIESQPTPKFAKGVVGIKGPGTPTSDEIPAWLSVGESVIKERATKRNTGLLSAMNNDKEQEYIQEFYIAPALKKQIIKIQQEKDKSFAQNIANSSMVNFQFKDGRLLDSLKQSRKNDKEIGRYIANAIKSLPQYNARKN